MIQGTLGATHSSRMSSRRRSTRSTAKTPPVAVSLEEGSVAGSAASLGSNVSKPVDAPVLKQVLQLIEDPEFGGIQRIRNKLPGEGHIASTLLDSALEDDGTYTFGARGSKLRGRIGKYITRWKDYDRAKYIELCNTYGVQAVPLPKISKASGKASGNHVSAPRTPQTPRKLRVLKENEDSGSVSDLSEDQTPAKPKPVSKPAGTQNEKSSELKSQPPLKQVDMSNVPPSAGEFEHFFCYLQLDCYLIACYSFLTEVITYDHLKRPECNRELFVVPLIDIPGVSENNKASFYEGYGILVPWDSRWAKEIDPYKEWYGARLYGTNQVLVTIPAYPFELYQCHGNYLKIKTGVPEFIQRGLDMAANDFDQFKETRGSKQLVLKFETGTELSATVLNKDAKDGVALDLTILPLSIKGKADVYACFVVARTDVKGMKRGKIEAAAKAKSKEAELAEELERLGI